MGMENLIKEDCTLEWTLLGDSSSQKPEGISKDGNNIICTSWKNKQFLFYAQERGAKIEPATPSWKLNLKWP